MEKTAKGWNVTLSEFSEISGLTKKTLKDAVNGGCPTIKRGKAGKGTPTIINVNEYLRWREERRPKNGADPKQREHSARAELAELELAKRHGELVYVADIEPMTKQVFFELRTMMLEAFEQFNGTQATGKELITRILNQVA